MAGRRVVDLTDAAWVKSTRSSAQSSNCVEVARGTDYVAVRDSKDPHGPALIFTHGEWQTFATDLKTGVRLTAET